jgi:phosphopantetheinyl transferase
MGTFFEFWTQKEAILKALGLPLSALANIAVKDKQIATYNYPQSTSVKLYTKALNLSIPTLFACICSTEAGILDAIEIKNVTDQLLV